MVEDIAKRLLEDATSIAEEYVRDCIGCGLCLAACTSHRALGDPNHSPPVRLRAAYRVLKGAEINPGELEALYTCSLCGACTAVCPLGIEVWLVVLAARMKLSLRGRQPRSLEEIARNVSAGGHSFTRNIAPLQSRLRNIAEEMSVPVDSPGEALYIPSPFETTVFPDVLRDSLLLLKKVGVEVTVSTNAIDFGGNAALDGSRPDIGLEAAMRAVEEAEKLGARMIILSGCGSDAKFQKFITTYGGFRTKVPIVSIYELLARTGFKPATPLKGILFPSCGFARFEREQYPLVRSLLSGLRLVRDKPPYTLCCGGGGGVNYLREDPLRKYRDRIYRWRIRMVIKGLGDAGIARVVTPCIKCYTVFRQAALLEKLHGKVRIEHAVKTLSAAARGETL